MVGEEKNYWTNKRAHEGADSFAVEIEGQGLAITVAAPMKPASLEKDFEVDDSDKLPTKMNKPGFGNKNKKLKSLNVLQTIVPSIEKVASSIVKERSQKGSKGTQLAPPARVSAHRMGDQQTVPAKFRDI